MNKLLLAVFIALAPAPFACAQSTDEMVEIPEGKPVMLREDRTYILFRTNAVVSPVFLRIPTDKELQAYDAAKRESFMKAEAGLILDRQKAIMRKDAAEKARRTADIQIPPVPTLENYNFIYDAVQNAQPVNLRRPLERVGDTKVMLIEALPGNYVLYGMSNGPFFETCFCLGTVSFTGKEGEISDLGTLLADWADKPSNIPELIAETGLGESMNGHLRTISASIRPATASTPVPTSLAGKTTAPADYRATGKFVANWASNINRLAPIPGILGYDKDKVLDLSNGTVARNQY